MTTKIAAATCGFDSRLSGSASRLHGSGGRPISVAALLPVFHKPRLSSVATQPFVVTPGLSPTNTVIDQNHRRGWEPTPTQANCLIWAASPLSSASPPFWSTKRMPKLALLPKRESQTIERLQNRIHELEEILGVPSEFPPTLGLTLSEEALLDVLFKREIMSLAAATAALYGSKVGGRPSDPKNVVSVLIMRLRKKLAADGIDIKTRANVGYYMTTEAKNRLRRIIAEA
jgi:hypothetical protein